MRVTWVTSVSTLCQASPPTTKDCNWSELWAVSVDGAGESGGSRGEAAGAGGTRRESESMLCRGRRADDGENVPTQIDHEALRAPVQGNGIRLRKNPRVDDFS